MSGSPITSRSATSSWCANADVFLIAPASANTIAKLAAGACRQSADQRRARRDLSAARRSGDEQPHVRARRDAGEPASAARARRASCSSPAPARWRRWASGACGRLMEPPELLAATEAAIAAAAPPTKAATGRRCACSSRPAARASRSTACASSATAPAGGWASRSPRRPPRAAPYVTCVAANVALPRNPRVDYVDVATAAELNERLRRRASRPATCC